MKEVAKASLETLKPQTAEVSPMSLHKQKKQISSVGEQRFHPKLETYHILSTAIIIGIQLNNEIEKLPF